MKKILLAVSSLLVLSMLVFVFSACDPIQPDQPEDTTEEKTTVEDNSTGTGEQTNTETESETVTETETETESETEAIDNGPWTLASSSVYCPADALAWEKNSAVYFINSTAKDAETSLTDEIAERQILIGRFCLTEEYQKADYNEIGYNGYSVYTVGTHLVITAKTDKGLRAAIDKVISDIGDGEIPEDYSAKAEENVTTVVPDANMHIRVDIDADTGYDVYKVPASMSSGYRYGPSIMVYEDGSMDAWFASSGCGGNQWDWITYKHSEDGINWSEEKVVLQPTPNGYDHYSCCDPGVVYFNGYYYLGYTSTVNENQKDNCVFVARSENPDGPYEKWNGNGWGGDNPMPIVYFDESADIWGSGEPSFVELNGTLYIYYTWQGSAGHMTYVSTADSTDPNWPATMKFQDVAIPNGSNDSIDVKYVEEYGKFIAIATKNRLSPNSYLAFFESNDGIHFTATSLCKKNVYFYCHNSGIAGSPDGHIKTGDKQLVGYAYGQGWGVWNTRFQEIKISLSDVTDFSENEGGNLRGEMARDDRDPSTLPYAGITCLTTDTYNSNGRKTIMFNLYAYTSFHDRWDSLSAISKSDKVVYSGYDENVVKCKDGTFRLEAVGPGTTIVTATWKGFTTSFCVVVPEDRTLTPAKIEPFIKDYFLIDTDSIKYVPQVKAIVTNNDGTWFEAYGQMLKFSDYDEDVIGFASDGTIYPKKEGKTSVTVSYGDLSYKITVETKGESLKYDYSKLNFADKEAVSVINSPNNASYEVENDCLKITSTNGIDSFIWLSYSGYSTEDYVSVTVEYMIPTDNSKQAYQGQMFYVAGGAQGPSEACSVRGNYVVDGEWHTITFVMAGKTGWSGDLTKMRFDFFDSCAGNDIIYVKTITLDMAE